MYAVHYNIDGERKHYKNESSDTLYLLMLAENASHVKVERKTFLLKTKNGWKVASRVIKKKVKSSSRKS